jgi:hypothetical protein
MEPGSGGSFWRFSLGEVLVAVAIDAVLVATVLDWVRFFAAFDSPPYVCYAVLALSFVVFPCIIVPVYFASYGDHGRGFRAWHSRRNDLLMGVDVLIVVSSLVAAYMNNTNRTRHIQVLAAFVPIVYTMYLSYRLIVEHLKRGSRVLEPAPGQTVPIGTDGPHPSVAESDALAHDER